MGAVKTTIEIPDPLFRKAKAHAAEHGQTLKDFVTDALLLAGLRKRVNLMVRRGLGRREHSRGEIVGGKRCGERVDQNDGSVAGDGGEDSPSCGSAAV
jgi:hypothetical protein